MKGQWQIWYGRTQIQRRRTLQFHPGAFIVEAITRLPIRPRLLRELINCRPTYRGAGYTFGSGVVYKFLETNSMTHILRAHQLCMEGFSSLFDGHLSTVWSAPNYCYRCGNSASILEVRPDGERFFNVFQAAPENERDGPSHQAAQNAGGKVSGGCRGARRLSGSQAYWARFYSVFSSRNTSYKTNDGLEKLKDVYIRTLIPLGLWTHDPTMTFLYIYRVAYTYLRSKTIEWEHTGVR